MWLEIFCGFALYKIFRRFFQDADEDVILDSGRAETDVKFSVARRLEKIYGGKAYVGLRIPDFDSGSRENVDIVLVSKQIVMVVSVRNFSGFVEVNGKGRWFCTEEKTFKKDKHPDPVAENKKQVFIIESYLGNRGITFPEGYLTGKVICPNPRCRLSPSLDSLTEVISFEKWAQLQPDGKIGVSSWIKGTFQGGKHDLPKEVYQKTHFALSTAPMWDRLELKDGRNILGEFLEFKGKQEDMQSLRNVKRSKVNQLIIQSSTMLGLIGRSKLKVLYTCRDYRNDETSSSEWNEAEVRSNTEILFQSMNSKKVRKLKLSSVSYVSLSG